MFFVNKIVQELKKKMDQSDAFELPENIRDEAAKALRTLIPEKSKTRYQKMYDAFKKWQCTNQVEIINEDVLLAYFHELVSYTRYLFLVL